MARAIAVPLRLAVLRRWQRGQPAADIADALALNPRTVRQLIGRFRRGHGAEALAPAYDRCGWPRPWRDPEVFQQALAWRRQHPSWGAGLIRTLLRERWPQRPLPSPRTLQRWFARAGLGPAPRGRRPTGPRRRARPPHDTWQMDAVEQLHLQRGQPACWLRLTDEATGAILHTKVFAVARWSQVKAQAVQAELRKAFARWGRPERLRVDNGTPWGSKGDLPTCLSLWVMGLQVALIGNPPRQPRRNAVVERSQGVSQQWVEPQTCASPAEWQRRLDRMDRLQRDVYPSAGGRSRRQRYPGLAHSGRPYTWAWEQRHWSLEQALECLAEYPVPRRVDQTGEVWLYDRSHWVGKPWRGQVIYVTIDPQTREWVYQDQRGSVLRREAAKHLTRAGIVGLRFGQSRHRPPRGRTSRPH